MPRKYLKKKNFCKHTLECATSEIIEGQPYRKVAEKYNISVGFLHKCVLRKKNNNEILPPSGRGRKTMLSQEVEAMFASTLQRMENMGLGPTLHEMRHIYNSRLYYCKSNYHKI
ncbi:UNVERIFIED_CONTAM: hypothetical protein RMT77_004168 [Armadillidium vulgare]